MFVCATSHGWEFNLRKAFWNESDDESPFGVFACTSAQKTFWIFAGCVKLYHPVNNWIYIVGLVSWNTNNHGSHILRWGHSCSSQCQHFSYSHHLPSFTRAALTWLSDLLKRVSTMWRLVPSRQAGSTWEDSNPNEPFSYRPCYFTLEVAIGFLHVLSIGQSQVWSVVTPQVDNGSIKPSTSIEVRSRKSNFPARVTQHIHDSSTLCFFPQPSTSTMLPHSMSVWWMGMHITGKDLGFIRLLGHVMWASTYLCKPCADQPFRLIYVSECPVNRGLLKSSLASWITCMVEHIGVWNQALVSQGPTSVSVITMGCLFWPATCLVW